MAIANIAGAAVGLFTYSLIDKVCPMGEVELTPTKHAVQVLMH